MIKCKTTDIPEFKNCKYLNSERWVIRLFYLRIFFIIFFLNYLTLQIFDNFSKWPKLLNFGNFLIFQIKNNKFLKFYNFILKRKKINKSVNKKNGITHLPLF